MLRGRSKGQEKEVKRRRTRGVGLWVGRKVKRRKTKRRPLHVLEMFRLWSIN